MIINIQRQHQLEKDDTEIYFKFEFVDIKNIDEDHIADPFINFVESHHSYWGGGFSDKQMTGCVDIQNSGLTIKEFLQEFIHFLKRNDSFFQKADLYI